jgi:hypothetical protein
MSDQKINQYLPSLLEKPAHVVDLTLEMGARMTINHYIGNNKGGTSFSIQDVAKAHYYHGFPVNAQFTVSTLSHLVGEMFSKEKDKAPDIITDIRKENEDSTYYRLYAEMRHDLLKRMRPGEREDVRAIFNEPKHNNNDIIYLSELAETIAIIDAPLPSFFS